MSAAGRMKKPWHQVDRGSLQEYTGARFCLVIGISFFSFYELHDVDDKSYKEQR